MRLNLILGPLCDMFIPRGRHIADVAEAGPDWTVPTPHNECVTNDSIHPSGAN
jgi:hypothetical protein